MKIDVNKLCLGVTVHIKWIVNELMVTGKVMVEHGKYQGACDWGTWCKFIAKAKSYGITVKVENNAVFFSL